MLVCQRGVLAAAKADAEEVIEMRGTLDRPLIVEAEVALALLRLALFCFQTWEVNNFGKTAAADSASPRRHRNAQATIDVSCHGCRIFALHTSSA